MTCNYYWVMYCDRCFQLITVVAPDSVYRSSDIPSMGLDNMRLSAADVLFICYCILGFLRWLLQVWLEGEYLAVLATLLLRVSWLTSVGKQKLSLSYIRMCSTTLGNFCDILIFRKAKGNNKWKLMILSCQEPAFGCCVLGSILQRACSHCCFTRVSDHQNMMQNFPTVVPAKREMRHAKKHPFPHKEPSHTWFWLFKWLQLIVIAYGFAPFN